MVRTHIQLREDQAAAIERLAHARSVSMAALIRDAVHQNVEREAVLSLDDRWQRSLAGVGGFRSGGRAYRRRTTRVRRCLRVSAFVDAPFLVALLHKDARFAQAVGS